MEAVLRRIPERERQQLYAVFDVYLDELAAHREIAAGPTDATSDPYVPLYWSEAGRHPFWIEVNRERAGFVLIREFESPERGRASQVSEFYVGPGFRRGGVGESAATQVWRLFPGNWELQVHALNAAAMAFWARAVAENATEFESVECREEDGRRLQYNFIIAAS